MWASQSSFASQAMGWQNSPIVFGNDANQCSLKDHHSNAVNASVTFALTTYLPAITLHRTEVTNPDIILVNASSLELLFGVEAGLKNDWGNSARDLICLRGQPRWPRSFANTLNIVYLLWLNDRQPVKVFKLLNDQQSDIFSNFKVWKEPIPFKLSYVYYELLSDPEELH